VRARLADRPRPFPHVTVKTAGAPSNVLPQYVHPIRLADRPRPKLGVFIGKALPTVSGNVTLTADQGSYILTGFDAQFIRSQFASPTVQPVGLPDRPRPFPHVTIKTLVAPASTVKATIIRARLPDRPRPFPHVTIGKALTAAINTTLTANFGSYTLTGADAAFVNSRFASPTVRPVRLPDRPRPFAHVFIGKAKLVGSVIMPAITGFYVLTGIDAGLLGPPTDANLLRWNLERAGWPRKRRKPTLLEILADIIEEDPPPKLAEKLSRRKKARASAEAQQWAEEIVQRAQRQAESYELEYAKATIATALREHAKSLIDAAIERRLEQEEEEAILLLLSHYH